MPIRPEDRCMPHEQALEGCRYAPNCVTNSAHHKVPRYLGKLGVMDAMAEGDIERAKLIRDFINCDENIRTGCRLLHDEWDKDNPTELPSDEEMARLAYE